jgi:hypothetical protein
MNAAANAAPTPDESCKQTRLSDAAAKQTPNKGCNGECNGGEYRSNPPAGKP